MLKRDYPLNEKNLDFWAYDKDSPYTEVKRFDWYRGYQVGGRSLMWGRQSYRWSDFDFEANAQGRHRHRLADPLRRHRALVRPRRAARRHRRLARRAAAASRRRSSSPPMPLNCGEELVAGRADEAVRRQAAHHPRPHRQPHPGARRAARACQYRNACWLGCPYGAYFSTQSSTLPAAVKTGTPDAQAVRDRQRSALRQGHEARDRRARARRRDEPDDRLHGEGRLPLRVDAQLDVAAHALGHRRVARRARQQLRRARPQPHGPPLPLRRGGQARGAGGQVLLRPASRPASTSRATATCSATSATTCAASATRAARAATAGRARSRSSASAARSRTRWREPGAVDDRRDRVRRDAAEPREHGLARRRRRRTSGDCRCSRSTAPPARTSGSCART